MKLAFFKKLKNIFFYLNIFLIFFKKREIFTASLNFLLFLKKELNFVVNKNTFKN